MANNVGTWRVGSKDALGAFNADELKYLRVQITHDSGDTWGEAVGVGWTPYLEVRKSGLTALTATVTGEWQSGGNEFALFPVGNTAALVPTAASGTREVLYEALVKLTDGASTTRLGMGESEAEPLSFAIQVWP